MLEQWVRQTAARFPPMAGYVLLCLGTGLAGLVLLALTAAVCVLCLVGTGFLVLPATLRVVARYAQFHRRRVGRLLGVQVRTAYQGVPDGSAIPPKPSLRDPAVRKDLLWLLCHSVPGTALCVLALVVCGHAVNWLTAPLWWLLLPAQRDRIILLTVDSWWKALAAVVVGVGYAFVAMALMRPLALLHAHASRRLLTARARTGLAERVRALTVSRAEALDAHDAELRRIERDLHDGAQADIVAVSLRLGMIRRALDRRPEQVPELVDVAQQQAEKALDALRQLVRGIYPPVLADRGLVEAVRALAALCAVPTRTDFGPAGAAPPPRAPAAAEAAAYFVVSEALTNVAKHSGAQNALVRLRITADRISIRVEDDGRGGAVESAVGASGLVGLRRRVAAFDGGTELSSPSGGPTVLKVEIPCGS
ncbi:sensor histidine kinase [Catenulispora pinisilvae]|uniref:sensor histidine kinase n=1 Tax=Catenulispora pinisilvae TaxID=2705253 RepID=UPI001891E5C4|nr:sensor histidine kinase [Catenulispora pinisilvae]